MSRRRSGYSTYRGRGRLQKAAKVVLVIVIVLILLTVAGLFLLEPYVEYSQNGVKILWPFTTPVPSAEVEDVADTPMVIITPSPAPSSLSTVRAVSLSVDTLTGGTAAQALAQANATAAIFDMKSSSGSLGYVSALELAKTAGASAATPGLNDSIRAANTDELYSIARVCCFRDNLVPYARNTTAIRTSGGNWRDADSTRWLSPSSQEAREYVVGVCVELAQLGFDEILLDYAAFPADGSLDRIIQNESYDEATLSAQVEAFYKELTAALTDYPDITLSIVAGQAAILNSPEDKTGQTAALLAKYADRVYLSSTDTEVLEDCTAALSQAGMTKAASRVVPLLMQAGAVDETWAVLSS